jgi:hypothetical protein
MPEPTSPYRAQDSEGTAMTTILEISLGLALVYLLLCMLVSSVQELIACYRNKRGEFLREGLNSLLTDRWIYLRTINHPSIVAFYRYLPGKGPAPSYLPASTVARALCDVLVRRHQMLLPGGGQVVFNLDAIKAAVRQAKERDSTLGQALLPLTEGAKTLEDALAAVAQWYEQSMGRVSGWYKAYSQRQLFLIGLVVAIALNIDSIAIVESLARAPVLRTEMAAAAADMDRLRPQLDEAQPHPGSTVTLVDQASQPVSPHKQQLQETYGQLNDLAAEGLPIGYACLGSGTPCNPFDVDSWLLKITGLLLTALAAMLGAPFWFDLINRAINLRGSGTKP